VLLTCLDSLPEAIPQCYANLAPLPSQTALKNIKDQTVTELDARKGIALLLFGPLQLHVGEPLAAPGVTFNHH